MSQAQSSCSLWSDILPGSNLDDGSRTCPADASREIRQPRSRALAEHACHSRRAYEMGHPYITLTAQGWAALRRNPGALAARLTTSGTTSSPTGAIRLGRSPPGDQFKDDQEHTKSMTWLVSRWTGKAHR